MKCICGSNHTKSIKKKNGIPLVQCTNCGIIRQTDLPFDTSKECVGFYREQYQISSLHSFEHDKEVARQRLIKYKLSKNARLLDVGSGNGAFVEVCRERGIKAVGCELGNTNSNYIYPEELQNINFPTDYFDVITCHDVLEHVAEPRLFLKEVFRILKQEGLFILDFPNFFVEEGQHHWKYIEHIWYMTIKQVSKFVVSEGFNLKKIDTPILSKKVLYLTKPIQDRITIAVPPGIGDVYWVMVKLQSFLQNRGLEGIPDIYVLARKKDLLRRNRSFNYIESIPFVNCTKQITEQGGSNKVWKKAYLKKSTYIFRYIFDCDYFISYNGQMRHGTSLEDLPGDCNWFPEMFYSLEQRDQEEKYRKQYGKFLVLYFVSQGMYEHWLKEFSANSIREALNKFAEETDTTLILTGGYWDKDDVIREELSGNNIIDLTGETTFAQLISLIKASQGVVGFPSGLTILATVLKKNTYMLWNDYFDEGFFTGACPTKAFNNWYFFDNTKDLSERKFKQRMMEIFKEPELKIACVLKTGGDFGIEDVIDLKAQIDKHITIPYQFICLTDVLGRLPKDITKVVLRYNLPGWWSKIELFRPDILEEREKLLYFDLDTAIVGDMTEITDVAVKVDSFMLLRAFNKQRLRKGDAPASGIMLFPFGNEQTRKIFESFIQNSEKNIKGQKARKNKGAGEAGDQGFIGDLLGWDNIKKIQDYVPCDFIQGKRQINGNKAKPEGVSIVAWSGTPRLKEMKKTILWLD